ncbi:MAG: biotin--[acetyl-CoA-carboxylase] ligase [Oscillospiraceae bacterium]|nr:biotin--[acetyl-CoA-carboxylase] ligase [Oscillospiraceae bacterium]
MNKQEIEACLKEKNLNLEYKIIYKASVDSTNNFAKKYKGGENLLVAAGEQTAGRGTYGKTFASPKNKGVYFTLKINSDININDAASLPVTAAVSVREAVGKLFGVKLEIKPPNDLIYETDGGFVKLCGILTETVINHENNLISSVIVGIGLNINGETADFPDDIKNIASSLKIITGKKYDSHDFANIICEITSGFTHRISRLLPPAYHNSRGGFPCPAANCAKNKNKK